MFSCDVYCVFYIKEPKFSHARAKPSRGSVNNYFLQERVIRPSINLQSERSREPSVQYCPVHTNNSNFYLQGESTVWSLILIILVNIIMSLAAVFVCIKKNLSVTCIYIFQYCNYMYILTYITLF